MIAHFLLQFKIVEFMYNYFVMQFRESEYVKSLESILFEIYNDEISMPRYKALDSLFFSPLPGLSGIIDVGLDEFTPWSQASPIQHDALESILGISCTII